MPPSYHIHPAIGIARLGNSPDEFCISPAAPAALPVDCDPRGNPRLSPDGKTELRVGKFKDGEGRVKRQAARFQIYVRDEDHPEGRPLQIGDRIYGGGNHGTLVDIQWRVYVANKKSAWYEFRQLEGEHGYASTHPRRNADITDDEARQRLIIDPGPAIVDSKDRRRASFSRDNPNYAPTFPPPLVPRSIDTLGEIMTDDVGRLLVLGGHGHSGTIERGFAQPRIDSYANNDGWFDDIADGPVMARLVMFSEEVGRLRFIDVEYPAWVIVGYPAYVPEILDIVTLDDVLVDLGIREFATRTDIYGVLGTFDEPQRITPGQLSTWKAQRLGWNPDHKPWFWRDVWPILFRADEFTYLTNVLMQSNFPHNASTRGTFDPNRLSVPPTVNRARLAACEDECTRKNHEGELFADALAPVLGDLHDRWMMNFRDRWSALRLALDELIAARANTPNPIAQEQVEQANARLQALLEQQPELMATDLLRRASRLVTEHAARFASKTASGTLAGIIKAVEGRLLAAKGVLPKSAADDPSESAETYARQWEDNYSEDGVDYGVAKQALRDDLDRGLVELRDQHLVAWQGAVAPLLELVGGWGPQPRALIQAYCDDGTEQCMEVPWDQLRARAKALVKDYVAGVLLDRGREECRIRSTYDPYRDDRLYLFSLLRQPGEENEFRKNQHPNSRIHNLPLMPLLCGDNPISNTLPDKFLRLTDYQLYILRQWAAGHFYNEVREGWVRSVDPWQPYAGLAAQTGAQLDRYVLSNLLGGAFCPGGEVSWIIRNPSIYHEPFRIRADPAFYNFRLTAASANANSRTLTVPDQDYESYTAARLSQNNNFATGLQPGDLTKYSGVPWQADFNECTTQNIDVTYLEWNVLYPGGEDDGRLDREQKVWETLWWPAHRPLQTWERVTATDGTSEMQFLAWSRGIPPTNAGDLEMVSAWWTLGFVVRNPAVPAAASTSPGPKYINVERSESREDQS